MTDVLSVLVEGSEAGSLTQDTRGRLRFRYSESYRARPECTCLSASMPVRAEAYGDATVRPWLSGLLPDNAQVLERWSGHFRASPSSPFSLLRTELGLDCAGAVQFAAPERIEAARRRAADVVWLTVADVAERLRDLREDATSWLGTTVGGQFTLAGAQAKTALRFDDGDWCVPSGSVGTTHIIKPSIAGFADHDLNEHLCLAAARRCGLVAARSAVVSFEDERALVVERYDRRPGPDGTVMRIHQEDLCQALGLPPSRRYQSASGPGPAAIIELLRELLSGPAQDQNVWRFIDALIWNWLIAGTDAHAKNYALLLSGSQVRLAPLYDLASALPYGTDEGRLKLAMTIADSYEVEPRHNHWPQAARELGVSAERMLRRVAELARVAPQAFAAAAGEPDLQALQRPLPALLVARVTDRCERCLTLLGV